MDKVDELMDFSATASAAADVNLLWRRDTSVNGIQSTTAVKRKLVGLACSCGSTLGYLVGLLSGQPMFTADLVTLSRLTMPLDCIIDIPVGSELAFYVHSTSGTDVCNVIAFVQHS